MAMGISAHPKKADAIAIGSSGFSTPETILLLWPVYLTAGWRDPVQINRGKCQWCVADLLGQQLPSSAILCCSTRTHCEINCAFNFYQQKKMMPVCYTFLLSEETWRGVGN